MGRKPDTPEEKAKKQAERDALNATKRGRTKPNEDQKPETPPTTMETTNTGDTQSTASNAENVINEQNNVKVNEQVGGAPETQQTDVNPEQKNVGTNYSPLGGKKTYRSYSRPEIDQSLESTVIPEANINIGNPIDEAKSKLAPNNSTNPTTTSAGSTSAPPQPTIIPGVEGFHSLQQDEQKQSAEQAAELILGTYDRLHWLGRKFVSVNLEDLENEHRRNLINQNLEAFENPDDPEGKGITIKEYFTTFNQQIESEFVVSEAFKNSVRPRLERVCLKRGWGASDETYLLFKFGEDIAVKTGMVIGFKKVTNQLMEEFRENHKQITKKLEEENEKKIAAEVERRLKEAEESKKD